MKNILVSIDFNEQEAFLMDKAYEFAKAFDAKIWLVHIAAPDPDFVGYDVGPQYIRDTRADDLRAEHKLLQDYAQQLEAKGVRAEGLLVQGATVEMIIKEAEKLNSDLIITGHHDHNFLYKAFMGSTSEEIIKESKIPVLLVPLD
ncbi:universal stress protein [Marivirga tractuosa]|jgi:nucleotide-binding universal stress UspA family protein|uniref:universal stress protein n=1 Tax=Marivirga tractuosa TaxID=1006 RepID=UPI0035CFAB29